MYPPPADSGPRVQLLPMIAPVTCGIDELADLGLLFNFRKHIYGLMQKRRNSNTLAVALHLFHDDIIKWNYLPHYFVQEIYRSPVISPHKGQCAELWCFLWSAPELMSKQTSGW